MPMSQAKVFFAVFTICALLFAGCGKEPEGTKFPEEVRDAVFDSVFALLGQGKISSRYDYEDARNRIAVGLFSTMRSDSLSRADSLYYGRLLFWSGRSKKARNVFEDLKAKGGKESRKAFLELINMEIEAGDASVAERMMTDYRNLYPPGSENRWGLCDQCENLGGRYNDRNHLDDAIRVYVDELNSLSYGPSSCSFSLMSDLTNTCQEADKLDVCRTQVLRCREGFEKGYAEYVDTVTYADSNEQKEDTTPKRYEGYIKACHRLLERIDLIGKPAPELTFIHVYNGDSSLTISSFKGKVVMLDFWATWCEPCIIGYSELRILLEEYGARGLEIIGVTSLQGQFTDIETGKVQENLALEREIEITGEYIKSQNLIWPCVILEKSIFNNEYMVGSIPTFVVIDREGHVRFIKASAGGIEQKRRMIERFL